MRALWWSCVLGLVCTSARVDADTVRITQTPSTTSMLPVNSSVSIFCTTTLEASGVYLKRRFNKDEDIIFLHIMDGKISKTTTSKTQTFQGQVEAVQESGAGLGVTITLSLLQVSDTDLYYCSWEYFNDRALQRETYPSNGSIVIIKEVTVSAKTCEDNILDIIFLSLSIIAVPVVLCLTFLFLFGMCKHFKKKFRPTRPVNDISRHRPQHRPQHMCQHTYQQHGFQTYSYLSTSVSSSCSQERFY